MDKEKLEKLDTYIYTAFTVSGLEGYLSIEEWREAWELWLEARESLRSQDLTKP